MGTAFSGAVSGPAWHPTHARCSPRRIQNQPACRFPTILYAGMFSFSPKPYFQSESGAEKAPTVQFDFGNAPKPLPEKQ